MKSPVSSKLRLETMKKWTEKSAQYFRDNWCDVLKKFCTSAAIFTVIGLVTGGIGLPIFLPIQAAITGWKIWKNDAIVTIWEKR